MATPRFHINVIPSIALIKSHYIETGCVVSNFNTSVFIDAREFQELSPEARALVFAQFEDRGSLLPESTYQIVTNVRLTTTAQIVNALIELLARDDQAMLDRLAMDWDRRVVQLAEDPDPGF